MESKTQQTPSPSFVEVGFGSIAALLGLVVMLGWHLRAPAIVQVFPGFVPMQFNTALGFVLGGTSFLLALSRWRALGGVVGTIVLLLGSITLAQYLFGLSIGLDTLFVEPFTTVRTSHPGRMAPNTALAFIMTSAAILLMSLPRMVVRQAALVGFLSALVLALAGIPLLGYGLGLPSAHRWGGLTDMALHTAGGFFLLGLGLLTRAWRLSGVTRSGIPTWAPQLVAISVFAATLLLWQAVTHLEQERILNQVELELSTISADLSEFVETKIHAVERMARRWNLSRHPDDLAAWEADARAYLEHMEALAALSYVTEERRIVASVEKAGAEISMLDIRLDSPEAQAAFEKALHAPDGVLSQPIRTTEAEPRILAIVPVGEREGYFVALFDVRRLLEQALGDHLVRQFLVQLSDRDGVFFTAKNPDVVRPDPRLMGSVEIQVAHTPWKLELFLSPEEIGAAQSIVDELILCGGLIGALLLSLTVHLLLRSREQALWLREANQRLEREIEERRNAQEALRTSEERFALAVRGTADGIWDWNVLTGDVYFAPRYEELLGYEEGELRGRIETWEELIHPDDRAPALAAVDAHLKNNVPYDCEIRLRLKNGDYRWFRDRGQAIWDKAGNPVRMAGSQADVHKRKLYEQQLGDLIHQLQRSNADLESFAYIASHDLQEPLRKIRSFGDRLMSRQENLDERSADYLRRMHSAAERMSRLINDLLQFSRVNTRGEEFACVPLEDVLAEVVSDLQPRIEESGAAIEWCDLPEVQGDPRQLYQLFQNLLSNALKFRLPGISPTVRVESINLATHLDGRKFRCISISDNGIGIDPAYAEKIFQPFRRLHGRAEYEGTGIGLAICRRIVDRHGGRIWVESQPGVGTTFKVTLPTCEESQPEEMT